MGPDIQVSLSSFFPLSFAHLPAFFRTRLSCSLRYPCPILPFLVSPLPLPPLRLFHISFFIFIFFRLCSLFFSSSFLAFAVLSAIFFLFFTSVFFLFLSPSLSHISLCLSLLLVFFSPLFFLVSFAVPFAVFLSFTAVYFFFLSEQFFLLLFVFFLSSFSPS